MMKMQKIIEEKLQKEFSPSYLEVVNDSAKHKGHIGDNGTGESHFLVNIKSDAFKDISKVLCHRMLFRSIKNEMQHIHAISFVVK